MRALMENDRTKMPEFCALKRKIYTEMKSNFAAPTQRNEPRILGRRLQPQRKICHDFALAKPLGGCRRTLIFEMHDDARSMAVGIRFSNHTHLLQFTLAASINPRPRC